MYVRKMADIREEIPLLLVKSQCNGNTQLKALYMIPVYTVVFVGCILTVVYCILNYTWYKYMMLVYSCSIIYSFKAESFAFEDNNT